MPRTPEIRCTSSDASTSDGQQMHDLRNAVNAAGFCVHAAEQRLLAGNVDKAIECLERASRSLERARDLLSLPAEAP